MELKKISIILLGAVNIYLMFSLMNCRRELLEQQQIIHKWEGINATNMATIEKSFEVINTYKKIADDAVKFIQEHR